MEPVPGVHEVVNPGQLSPETGMKLTTVPESDACGTVMSAGHSIVGFSVSLTVTVKEQLAVLPDASVAVLVTVVVPFGKVEPEGGLLTTVTPGQLSLAVTE